MYAIELVLIVASTSSLALTLAASVGGTYGAMRAPDDGFLWLSLAHHGQGVLLRSLLCTHARSHNC
jgi:hypothetical protein